MSINKEIFDKQKQFFRTGKTLDINFRIEQLKKLKEVIKRKEDKILEALNKDLRKSRFEGYITEVSMVYEEINLSIKSLRRWSKKQKVKSPLAVFPAKSYIYYEPYGTVLIIGPFNYPFQLNFSPLVGAISAGNTAMIKPSESVMETTNIIKEIIEETFDENYIAYVNPEKGKEVVEELLKFKYDYIFFTGSVTVGKIIMRAAADNLIPITLELGGKSPCIVDSDAKLKLAARRVVWGKLINSGQTCVAPDYIYVHKSIKDKFLEALAEEIKIQYGENVRLSEDYPRMVNDREFERVISYINKEKVYFGGNSEKEDLYIEPTILSDVNWNDDVMQNEIFGPLFPVMGFEEINDVIESVSNREKPLALYYFSESKEKINYILKHTTAGGVTINDTLMHVSSAFLPFGGVGNSGIGSYHGKESFTIFSHKKSVLNRATWFDMPLRYAPFKDKLSFAKKILK